MRPVERGAAPENLTITDYTDAAEDLRMRLGRFCSYCERPLSDITDVEHVRPKKHFPGDKLEWSNFLLACSSCNRIKGAKPADDVANYVFPDRDNPMIFISYEEGKVPAPKDGLPATELARIQKTIQLVGLARDNSTVPKASGKDTRWQARKEAWVVAKEIRRLCELTPGIMNQNNFPILIRESVRGRGFFSVWITAFDGLPEVRNIIIDLMPGTAKHCFDANGNPIARA